MEGAFGGRSGDWHNLFGIFIKHLYTTFYHKITGNSLSQWTAPATVENFRRMIWSKLKVSPCQVEKWLNGDINHLDIIDIAFELFRSFGFIDDTAERTCRPGSGPEPGEQRHAARKEFARVIQAAFYNGYYKAHGVKYQTVIFPHGIWGSVFGASLRHNDKGMLNMSGIVEYLRDLLQPIPNIGEYPGLYGDDIFPEMHDVIFRKIRNPQTDEEHVFNKRMSCLRQCIELAYGSLFNMFPILKDPSKHKLMIQKTRAIQLGIVCFFLHNCRTCMRGNEVNTMFNSQPPTLDEYIPLDEHLEPFDLALEDDQEEDVVEALQAL